MSTDANLPPEPPEADDDSPEGTPAPGGNGNEGRILPLPIDEELKNSYLTYSMSVIVSRALPDVRDGLKPSQRRILVAMSDLGLTPGASTSKCAGIVGETMKRYHPHGDMAIYPTLVRLAQDWNTRYPLIDKQGNFGSIAGLPAAAMRYTEARMSTVSALMLDDVKLDTVDYLPTYDDRSTEPAVLPSKFPNLLVNGSQGIAVGMATSIPPHNLVEICDALIAVIDNPDISIDELMEIVPGPDFPTGNIVVGRAGAAARLPYGPEQYHAPRQGPHRRARQGPLPHRRQRGALSGCPRRGGKTHRGNHQRRPDRRHLGRAERKRPEGTSPPGLRAQARR